MIGETHNLRVIPAPSSAPNENIIETLEHLLAAAKDGTIRAFAYGVVKRDTIATGWDGGDGSRLQLTAALSLLSHRYNTAMLSEDSNG